MKVAMVTPYWAPVLGGPTTYVAELAAELRTRGHEVLVVAHEGGTEGATIVPDSGRVFAARAATVLDSFRPDVVHAHAHWYTLAAAVRHARRRTGCALVFTIHTAFPRMALWRRIAFRRLMGRSDYVTAVSGSLLGEVLEAFYVQARTHVTHPGVSERADSGNAPQDLLRESGLSTQGPIIGWLGQMSWPKKVEGLQELVRAMRIVRESLPDARLIVGGDGPHRDRLEVLAAREAPGAITFLGEVQNPTPRFFSAANVYAHISYQEGFPHAILEAMESGTPVVASAVGGIPEVIRDGDNGYLVPNDPALIARYIIGMLKSEEVRDRLARSAKADLARRFRWKHVADRFLPLYGHPTRHRVLVTVDLERDYPSPQNFRGVSEAWPRISDLFDQNDVRALVFATSDLADRFPDALRHIASTYDLGCHGESHDVEYLCSKPYRWQVDSIRRATEALKECTGASPRWFRAPNFSANGETIRALEKLGYRFDSSVLPGRVVRRFRVRRVLDFLAAPRDPYRPSRSNPAIPGSGGLWEVPVAENPFALGGPIGLGYIHAYGVDRTLAAISRSAGDPCVVLIHPWELLDPPPTGNGPAWLQKACTSDPTQLDEFLRRVGREHEVVAVRDLRGLTDSTTAAPPSRG